MFNLKKFVWFISAFALFSFVVAGQHAEAGPYEGVRLLLDGYAPAEDDSMMAMMFGDRVNNNVTSVVPPAAGDTVDIEIYVSDAPAPWQILTFSFDDTDSMFSANFAVDTLLSNRGVVIDADEISVGGIIPSPFKDNMLVGVLSLIAKRDVPEGTTLSVSNAGILLPNAAGDDLEKDTLDVSMAMITFEQPKAPKLEILDMGGMMIADPVAVKRDADAPPDTVTIAAKNFAVGDTISWSVSRMGSFDITVLDQDGMMMEGMMFATTGSMIKVYAKGMGDAGSASVYAYSGMDTTDVVTVEFSLENPVELASFGGELAEDRVVLNWTTASQTNNAGWRMLRSVDGKTYEPVGEFVSGAGTSDALVSYSFVDNNPPSAEKVFYVLEQVDLDGTIHRSNAVEVTLGARFVDVPTEFATNVYPNPFNPSTTISYDLPSDALISIVIYDATGQVVRQLVNEQRFAGRYQVRWDAKDNLGRSVGSGVYIAKVEAGSFSASQKMLLLK
jgi:hypothetical protein